MSGTALAVQMEMIEEAIQPGMDYAVMEQIFHVLSEQSAEMNKLNKLTSSTELNSKVTEVNDVLEITTPSALNTLDDDSDSVIFVGEEFPMPQLEAPVSVKIEKSTSLPKKILTKVTTINKVKHGGIVKRKNINPRLNRMNRDAWRIVLRGVPISIDTNEIENELGYMGYPVLAAFRIHLDQMRRPVPLVLVYLKNSPSARRIYGITNIFNYRISAERFLDINNNRGCSFSRCSPSGRMVISNFEDLHFDDGRCNSGMSDSSDGCELNWDGLSRVWAELYPTFKKCTSWNNVVMTILDNADRIKAEMF